MKRRNMQYKVSDKKKVNAEMEYNVGKKLIYPQYYYALEIKRHRAVVALRLRVKKSSPCCSNMFVQEPRTNQTNTGPREGLEQPVLGCWRCGVFKLAATTPQNSTKSYTLDFVAYNSSVASQIPHNSDATKLDTHISFNYEHKINYVLPEKCRMSNAEGSKSDDSFLQFIFIKALPYLYSRLPPGNLI